MELRMASNSSAFYGLEKNVCGFFRSTPICVEKESG